MKTRALVLAGALLLAPAVAHAGTAAGAPTRTARFGRQTFGYRSIGRGRPVVFVMGMSGAIDAWPPSFLDTIAAGGHRVVIFDNEGVGRSSLRPGTLTVGRMAQDTARLVTALHLRRPDVVGWSMGGMIAQSLAVRYPKRLRKLVLMATAPGDGKATLPDTATLTALSSGDEAALLGDLFPSDQVAARDRYIADLLMRFDLRPIAPPAVIAAQLSACAQWMAGSDPDGARIGRLEARALVAGGELDPVLPVANQRHLAAVIPHAKLLVYPDAAHGFFFQDAAAFAPRLTAFLR